MLLETYTKKIFRAECNPQFESLHCIARLDQDVSEALPYLNAVLGGFEYLKDPPAVMFRSRGRLITVHAREIAVNALKDEAGGGQDPGVAQTRNQPGLGQPRRHHSQHRGGAQAPGARNPEASSPHQLPAVRGADLHGVRGPGGRRGEERHGLPAAHGGGSKTAGGLSGPVQFRRLTTLQKTHPLRWASSPWRCGASASVSSRQ